MFNNCPCDLTPFPERKLYAVLQIAGVTLNFPIKKYKTLHSSDLEMTLDDCLTIFGMTLDDLAINFRHDLTINMRYDLAMTLVKL